MNTSVLTSSDKLIQPDRDTARIEAFSDGVFAVAMTLLVVELHVPMVKSISGEASGKTLWAALLEQWPGYFAYLTSFLTILTMWVHHHAMFKLVRRTDLALLLTNGLLLMLVTTVPFPTAVLATYLQTDAARLATAFYSGMFVLIACAFSLLLRIALRPQLLMPDASPAVIRHFCNSYRFGPLLYLFALAAALVSSWLSLGICTVLYLYWTVVGIMPMAQQEGGSSGT